MRETDVRDALKTYVTDGEPAMGLTADAVLTAGRRSRRIRRVAAFGAFLAGVGVVATVYAGTSTGGEDYAVAAPCPVQPGPRPSGAVAADRPLSPEQVEWAAANLTCYLNDELSRLLPEAEFGRVPGAPAGPLVGFSHGGQPPWGNRVDALALFRDAEGAGDLMVTVGVLDEPEAARAEDECRRERVSKCTVRSGPDGAIVLVGTEADSTPAEEPRNYLVRVYRGHTEIYVQVSNTDRRAVDGGAPAATRPEPVLSEDQAVELALSPELYLFP